MLRLNVFVWAAAAAANLMFATPILIFVGEWGLAVVTTMLGFFGILVLMWLLSEKPQ